MKLVGGSFVPLFADGLKELVKIKEVSLLGVVFAHVEQFMEAFYRMPDGRTRLCHVLDTWKNVFPDALVQSIRSSIPAAVPASQVIGQRRLRG